MGCGLQDVGCRLQPASQENTGKQHSELLHLLNRHGHELIPCEMVHPIQSSQNDSSRDKGIGLRPLDTIEPPLSASYWLNLESPGPLRLAPARRRQDYGKSTLLPDLTVQPLDGDVMLCRCPECGAPMTLRLWLSIADCWQCEISIALTVEQVRSLARPAHATAQRQAPPDRAAEIEAAPTALSGAVAEPPPPPAPSQPRTRPVGRRTTVKRRRPGTSHWLRNLPAWIVSGILHMVLLALLALLLIEVTGKDPSLVLSTEISPWRREGGPQDVEVIIDNVKFDLPIPPDAPQQSQPQRLALIRADQDARLLRLDQSASQANLPDLDRVKTTIARSDSRRAMLAARDPRVRVEMIRQEGGTTLTEAAVARGLRWMHLHQNEDGSWSLERFHQSGKCNGRCNGQGQLRSDAAATALVLLPFLGAGQTHLVGQYQDSVSLGLRWLIEHQESNGDLRADSSGNAGMYAHGQASIVLCEAYAMTGDAQLRESAQRSIDFIVAGQHEAGGWRYQPDQAGDTSVLGWQLMALQSARAAGLNVPSDTLENAGHFLDSVGDPEGALYAYMPGQRPTPVMTAEALLCRMYLGWEMSHVGMRTGVDHLVRAHTPERQRSNFYYWYYGTQVMHHVGGAAWRKWNHHIRDVLVAAQDTSGHQAGSWKPLGNHDKSGGRLYTTALATCTLEVYYRHVPIFRRLKLD